MIYCLRAGYQQKRQKSKNVVLSSVEVWWMECSIPSFRGEKTRKDEKTE